MQDEQNDVIPSKLYRKLMDFRPWHRVVLSVACLGVAFWFLCPALFGHDMPVWVFAVAFPPVLLWLVIAFPRHARAMRHPALKEACRNPLLMTRCMLPALLPDREERKGHMGVFLLACVSLATFIGSAVAGVILLF